MRPVLIIAWREYKQYVFSRGFLLFLVLFPVIIVVAGATVNYLEHNKPMRDFVVYDETGKYTEYIDEEIERRHYMSALSDWNSFVEINVEPSALDNEQFPKVFASAPINERRLQAFIAAGGFDAAQKAVEPFLKSGAMAFTMPRRAFRRLPLPVGIDESDALASVEMTLRPFLLGEQGIHVKGEEARELFAAVLIPNAFGPDEGAAPAQYWSRNLTDPALEMTISSALDKALRREAIKNFGLSKEMLDEVLAIDAPVSAFRPDREAAEAELGMKDRIETALPAVLTYMLLVIIFGVGNLLLTNTIEERSNKIVEILLSSVTANQLMMGKLVGIAAVGLTMPAMFLTGAIAMSLMAAGEQSVMSIAVVALFSSNLIYIYVFYFLCAYVIFAMIFLAIGAVSNSLQDAQSYMGPVMLIVFAPLPLMMMVFQNPNGLAASILTWIPLYTPYAVMLRAGANPPLWEILGATALMLVFALVLMRFMGRIFRNAILQASPPKMRDVWRLARSSKD